ncbi:PadR family transcriptional regulator (plasmid) [Haloferacaceae archaeon DSL9]
MSVYELSGFQRDLLFVIAGLEKPSGQEVGAEVQETQDRTVFHGRLYSNLDTLVEAGFVEKRKYDGRTNLYRITPKGRRELRELRKWQERYIRDVAVSESHT